MYSWQTKVEKKCERGIMTKSITATGKHLQGEIQFTGLETCKKICKKNKIKERKKKRRLLLLLSIKNVTFSSVVLG